jgi:hypothetical protein
MNSQNYARHNLIVLRIPILGISRRNHLDVILMRIYKTHYKEKGDATSQVGVVMRTLMLKFELLVGHPCTI